MTKATPVDPPAPEAQRASGEVVAEPRQKAERTTTPPDRFGFHRISTTLFGRILREPVPRLADDDLYRTRIPGEVTVTGDRAGAPAGEGDAAEPTGADLPLRSRAPQVVVAVVAAVLACLAGVWLIGSQSTGSQEPASAVGVPPQEPGGDHQYPARAEDVPAATPAAVGVEPGPKPGSAAPSSPQPEGPEPAGTKASPSEGEPTEPRPVGQEPSEPSNPRPASVPSAPVAPSAAPDLGWFPD